MSQGTQVRRGHAPQQSVADAAMLFGSASDDPFAGIGGAEVEPIAEEGAQEEEAADVPAADAQATPTAAKVSLPESTHEAPAADTASGSALAASPSALFAGSSDLFPASASTDWLNQGSGTQEADQVFGGYEGQGYAAEGGEAAPSQDYQQPYFNGDNEEAYNYGDGVYTQQGADQYGGQYDYGVMGENTYVQDDQGQNAADFGFGNQEQQHQYQSYDNQQGQYYDQQQSMDTALYNSTQQVYDPNAYTQEAYDPSASYQQGGADYSSTYGQQSNPYYEPANGATQQPDYQFEQYGEEATYDQDTYGQQATFDEKPSQPHGDGYNLEEAAPYSRRQKGAYDASASDGPAYSNNPYMASTVLAAKDGTGASSSREVGDHDGAPEEAAAESLPALQNLEDHVAGMEEGIEEEGAGYVAETNQGSYYGEYSDTKAFEPNSSTAEPNEALGSMFDQENGANYYEENGMYDTTIKHDDSLLYAGEDGATDHYGMNGLAATSHGSREASSAMSPYDPPAANAYAGNSYGEYAPEQYGAYSADTSSEAPYGATDVAAGGGEDATWQSSDTPAEGVYGAYDPSQGYDNYQHQQESDAKAGYFDNVSVPSAPLYGSINASTRSADVQSPYTPNAGEDRATPMGSAGYMAQERAVDAAEERHRAKIPLACFTIDGKLLTFFPTWPQDASDDAYGGGAGGYGLGRSAAPTKVTIRDLRTVVPPTSYSSTRSPLDFPGPALEVIPSQGSALSRATGAATASSKAKKVALIKYLNDAATEMASGIGYLTAGKHAAEAKRMQDRILLLRLLVILLEQDGIMTSSATFDTAVKDLLLADQMEAPSLQSSSSVSSVDAPLAPSTERKSAMLHQIEALLTAGKRKEAVSLAVEKKLWTHAVIIASGMDRSTWREVVGEFVEEEFGNDSSVGLHGVKVAYNLFSGQEPKATYDLFRPKAAFTVGEAGQNSEASALASHSYWRKSMATIIANRSSGDAAAMTAIGDGLKMSGWVEAAHICYLLSPSTSPMDGYDSASTRMTLLGAASPEASTTYIRDLDHIILTEVLEYAQSLQPVAKGQEPYHGLAYLQPYRLLHAYLLAEMGEVKKALRYCEAITTLLKHGKMNRHYHSVLLQQLQELSHRLQGDSKGSNWTKKKPTMDGVWGALEGRFTKFIAGEDEGGKDVAAASKGQGSSAVGPFTHYSAITPDARSGGVSRVQSHADFSAGQGLSVTSASQPLSRPGSALNYNYRTASASDYDHGDWGTPPAPTHAKDTSNRSSPKPSVGQQSSSDAESYVGPYTTHASRGAPWYRQDGSAGRAEEDEYGSATAPADSTYYGYQPHGATHSQFASNVDEDLTDAMQNATLDDSLIGNAPTPGPAMNNYAPANKNSYDAGGAAEDDEEDLGFGNKSSRPAPRNEGNGEAEGQSREASSSPEKKAEPANKPGELKPAASWFGRLWKRDTSGDTAEGTKAKKAHLGEEVSFYYDKDLKRWVNKKAGDSGQAAAPPPPPPRAQTASPSAMGNGGSRPPEGGSRRVFSEARAPPAAPSSGSSTSSIDRISATPPIQETGERSEDDGPPSRPSTTTGGRSRSNLADHSQPPAMQPGHSATPPIRPGTTDGGPPRTVSGSGIKKKPISKRYVRVD